MRHFFFGDAHAVVRNFVAAPCLLVVRKGGDRLFELGAQPASSCFPPRCRTQTPTIVIVTEIRGREDPRHRPPREHRKGGRWGQGRADEMDVAEGGEERE